MITKYYPEKPVVTINSSGKKAIEFPVLIIPGMNANTIAIAVGYGRSERTWKSSRQELVKMFIHFHHSTEQRVDYSAPDVTVTRCR